MINHFYEVAVLTPFTSSRPEQQKQLPTKDVFLHRASSPAPFKPNLAPYTGPGGTYPRPMPSYQTNVAAWSRYDQHLAGGGPWPGDSWSQHSLSLSSISLHGSAASWERASEVWSSESMHSLSSGQDAAHVHHSSMLPGSHPAPLKTAFTEVTFQCQPEGNSTSLFDEVKDMSDRPDIWRSDGHLAAYHALSSTATSSGAQGPRMGLHEAYLEQGLSRVAQDLTALHDLSNKSSFQSLQCSKYNMAPTWAHPSIPFQDEPMETEIFTQPLPKQESDQPGEKLCEPVLNVPSISVPSVILDSGHISRSSSYSSIVAGYSNASEDNLADEEESYDDFIQVKNRKLKRKLKQSDVVLQSKAESENNTRVKTAGDSDKNTRLKTTASRRLGKTSCDSHHESDTVHGGSASGVSQNSAHSEAASDLTSTSSSRNIHGIQSQTSGYSDSGHSQCVSSDSDISELNPFSRPFVPKDFPPVLPKTRPDQPSSYKHFSSHVPISTLANILMNPAPRSSSVPVRLRPTAVSNNCHWQDSGVVSSFNATRPTEATGHTWVPSCPRLDNNQSMFSHSSVSSHSWASVFNKTTLNRSSGWSHPPSGQHMFSHKEPAPYDCRLDHGADFTNLSALSIDQLPHGYQNWEVMTSLIGVSQRVVKLRVIKPFRSLNSLSSNSDLPCKESIISDKSCSPDSRTYDHYGTGFACQVDKDFIMIRTHSQVVGNCKEASQTEVSFVLTLPHGCQSPTIRCCGVAERFSSSPFSQTCKFACRTPEDLLPYLHVFDQIPVVRRASLFDDSCYFSDSSPNTSTSDSCQFDNMKVVDDDTSCNLMFSQPRLKDYSQDLATRNGHHFLRPSYTQISGSLVDCGTGNPERLDASYSHQHNPLFPQCISGGLMSEALPACLPRCVPMWPGGIPVWPSVQALYQSLSLESTPLSIMESRHDKSIRQTGSNQCLYSGQNMFGENGIYTHFSNSIGSALNFPLFTDRPTSSTPDCPSWEYERLVYAQSHHRQDYNSCHKQNPSPVPSSPPGNPRDDSSSLQAYLASWDRDLLNLEDDLSPCLDTSHLTAMLDSLLNQDSQDGYQPTPETMPTCCHGDNLSRNGPTSVSQETRTRCLVISFPHGGQKAVSWGHFSRHHHVGGTLYDTPTCMGSCGAPVLALNPDFRLPYLTQFLHSGTVKVNGVTAAAGVLYFD